MQVYTSQKGTRFIHELNLKHLFLYGEQQGKKKGTKSSFLSNVPEKALLDNLMTRIRICNRTGILLYVQNGKLEEI